MINKLVMEKSPIQKSEDVCEVLQDFWKACAWFGIDHRLK
jgi:hypothetical protein